MRDYLHGLKSRLREAGFAGRVLMVTSQGGMMDADDVAEAPIHAIGSGPAMAPVAGRHYAALDAATDTAVVADTGGTSYDVSLVRQGRIPWTRETWLGQRFRGHMTGFPSVDVKSIGAGGGSIGWVDAGGLLHCGPQSAGSRPGPACYGTRRRRAHGHRLRAAARLHRPGVLPRRRDAPRPRRRARGAGEPRSHRPLGLGLEEAAAAVLALATEKMVGAIEEITINQGIDPRSAVLIGGGGAAGLNAVAVARRLGCREVVIPEVGAALSAAGALMSDLSAEYGRMAFATSDRFDARRDQRRAGGASKQQCRAFIAGPGEGSLEQRIDYTVEARYPHQIWEIEVPMAAWPLPRRGRTCARWSRASTRPTSRSSRSAIRSPRSSS